MRSRFVKVVICASRRLGLDTMPRYGPETSACEALTFYFPQFQEALWAPTEVAVQ